jgi:hypothetical protein
MHAGLIEKTGWTFGIPESLPEVPGYETIAREGMFLRVKKEGDYFFLLDRGDRWELWPEKFDEGFRRQGNERGSYADIGERFYIDKPQPEEVRHE